MKASEFSKQVPAPGFFSRILAGRCRHSPLRLGYWATIENPVSKNKSVGLTEAGRAKSEGLFAKLFGKVK